MERSPIRDFIVGLFVLAGLAAIIYMSVSIGGFQWYSHGGLKISAGFGETGDLTVRAPVVIAGVKVGEVTAITLDDKDFRARVDMDLDSKLQLPTETEAAIVTAGMLGDRYIELTPGNNDEMLKSGGRIAKTYDAMILEKMIGQFIYGITKSSGSDTKPATPADSATKP